MSTKKKTAKKKGRGGKRPGAGRPRKTDDEARRALLSVRVSESAKFKIEATAHIRKISPGELVQEWAERDL